MNPDYDIFREWDLYDRIGRSDFMRHQEISAAVRAALGERREPVAVIDLGCGDGWMSHLVFGESTVSGYVAVDLSEAAIEGLSRRPCPGTQPAAVRRQLICGDIAATVRNLPACSFDIVFASFSLHHYRTDAKPAMLDDLRRLLKQDGWLVWIDSMVRENESRESFFARLTHDIGNWKGIAMEERNSVIDHVLHCDHPETRSWMIDALAARGLTRVRDLYRDEFYGALLFEIGTVSEAAAP